MENPEIEQDPITDPIDELPDEIRQDIEQIISQGNLSEGFSFGGHSFVIKTLNVSELNAVALAMKPYQGSLREVNAYMQATVGLALVMYDGKPDFHIKLDDLISHAMKRMEFIGNWDDVTLQYVFGRYSLLDNRRIRARQELINLPEQVRPNSLPFADSLTELGIFSGEMPTGIPFSQT